MQLERNPSGHVSIVRFKGSSQISQGASLCDRTRQHREHAVVEQQPHARDGEVRHHAGHHISAPIYVALLWQPKEKRTTWSGKLCCDHRLESQNDKWRTIGETGPN